MKQPLQRFSAALSQRTALAALLTLVACGPNPGSGGAGGGIGGGGGGGAAAGPDYEWTRWRVPLDAPRASGFQVSDHIVTDTVTGLQWQQTSPPSTFTWANAKAYCAAVSLGGWNWRLPTLIELESILGYDTYNPALNTVVFPHAPVSHFWSSSPDASKPSRGWVVAFSFGYADNVVPDLNRARCVRCAEDPCEAPTAAAPGAPPGRYTLNPDTVLDTTTKLTWQRNVPPTLYSWAAAATHCQSLTLGGLTQWRVPTVKELQSLVDIRAYNPAIDTVAFPSTEPRSFWSSSATASNPTLAWSVDFYFGNSEFVYKITYPMQVRCVRSEK